MNRDLRNSALSCEKRERFETTLKPELKQKLKLVAVKRNVNINELIEEWIRDLKYTDK